MNCQWLCETEEGYSSWTVMGYQADCMFQLNSFNSDDEDHDKKNEYGATCPHFTKGIHLYKSLEDAEENQTDKAIEDWIALVTEPK
jgi:hypothetical protein